MKSNPVKALLTISMGFLVIYIVGVVKWEKQLNWALTISLIIGLIGMFSTKLSLLVEKLWMQLAKILSFIIPNIILGLVFFCFLFPIALLSKVFRKADILRLKNNSDTVYTEKNKSYDTAHFENMW